VRINGLVPPTYPDPRAYFVGMPDDRAMETTAPWSELSKQAVVQGLAVTRSRKIDRSNPNQRMPAAQEKNAACPFRVAKMIARPVWHCLRTSED
jgi:hypothetical protein